MKLESHHYNGCVLLLSHKEFHYSVTNTELLDHFYFRNMKQIVYFNKYNYTVNSNNNSHSSNNSNFNKYISHYINNQLTKK